MKTESPPITVLLPVFNGEMYLEEAIQSVLDQSFSHFEFLIINDGSTDSSAAIITAIDDNRIRIVDNKDQRGLVDSLNLGIALAKGKFIARIDADDIWLKDKLSIQYEFLESNKDIALCGTFYESIEENGDSISREILPTSPAETFYQLFWQASFIHSSVVFNKETVIQLGGYDNRWKYVEDFDLWGRLSKHRPVINLPIVLTKYRVHNNTISKTHFYTQQLQILRKIEHNLNSIDVDVSHEIIDSIRNNTFIAPALFLEIGTFLRCYHNILLNNLPRYLAQNKFRLFLTKKEQEFSEKIKKVKNFEEKLLSIYDKNNPDRIAFYGAGSIANLLLDIIENHELPFPEIIFDKFPERCLVSRSKVDSLANILNYKIETILITNNKLNTDYLKTILSQNIVNNYNIMHLFDV